MEDVHHSMLGTHSILKVVEVLRHKIHSQVIAKQSH